MQSAGKIEHETILHQQDEFTQSPLCLTNSNSFKLHLTESRQCMMVKQVGNNNSKCTFESLNLSIQSIILTCFYNSERKMVELKLTTKNI